MVLSGSDAAFGASCTSRKPRVTNLIGWLEFDRQKICMIILQVYSPIYKHFPRALYQTDKWDKSEGSRKRSVWRARFSLFIVSLRKLDWTFGDTVLSCVTSAVGYNCESSPTGSSGVWDRQLSPRKPALFIWSSCFLMFMPWSHIWRNRRDLQLLDQLFGLCLKIQDANKIQRRESIPIVCFIPGRVG